MATYGKNSTKEVATCMPVLRRVLNRHILQFDSSAIEGYRGKTKQNNYFKKKVSKVKWPDSDHNRTPSRAIDLYPYHNKYKSLTTDKSCIDHVAKLAKVTPAKAKAFIIQQYHRQAQSMMDAALVEGIELLWGGDWDGDLDTLDQNFNDLGHFALVL